MNHDSPVCVRATVIPDCFAQQNYTPHQCACRCWPVSAKAAIWGSFLTLFRLNEAVLMLSLQVIARDNYAVTHKNRAIAPKPVSP